MSSRDLRQLAETYAGGSHGRKVLLSSATELEALWQVALKAADDLDSGAPVADVARDLRALRGVGPAALEVERRLSAVEAGLQQVRQRLDGAAPASAPLPELSVGVRVRVKSARGSLQEGDEGEVTRHDPYDRRLPWFVRRVSGDRSGWYHPSDLEVLPLPVVKPLSDLRVGPRAVTVVILTGPEIHRLVENSRSV